MNRRVRWVRRFALAAVLLLAAGLMMMAPDLTKMDYWSLFSRAAWQLPDRVIKSLDIRPCDRVADIGAGDGYFTLRLARAVGPSGRVALVDMKASLLVRLLVPPDHWTSVATIAEKMAGASYTLVGRFDYLPAQSFAVFRPTPN
jgi:hypothetical protein